MYPKKILNIYSTIVNPKIDVPMYFLLVLCYNAYYRKFKSESDSDKKLNTF